MSDPKEVKDEPHEHAENCGCEAISRMMEEGVTIAAREVERVMWAATPAEQRLGITEDMRAASRADMSVTLSETVMGLAEKCLGQGSKPRAIMSISKPPVMIDVRIVKTEAGISGMMADVYLRMAGFGFGEEADTRAKEIAAVGGKMWQKDFEGNVVGGDAAAGGNKAPTAEELGRMRTVGEG